MTSNVGIGMLYGFGAAMAISVSYILSRTFVRQPARSPLQLLILAHVIMGIFSLALLPWTWSVPVGGWASAWLAATSAALFYLAAQALLFYILRETSASNIAPLLGLKIGIAALIGLALGNTLTGQQWLAVLLTLVAALLLRNSAEGVTLRLIGLALATCGLYCGSDYSIGAVMEAFGAAPNIRTVLFAVTLPYLVCGALACAGFGIIRRATKREWHHALAYASAWYAGMIGLFGAISYIGVVFGIMMQSTRGIITVLLGIVLVAVGVAADEGTPSVQTRCRQLIAAVLMITAIALYQSGLTPA
ncbi:MAG TPA: hypothetical protein DCR55_10100 [Lentisphaeria bacterium]|nr:hypothetical protein [Lentisphaeria bacterium]